MPTTPRPRPTRRRGPTRVDPWQPTMLRRQVRRPPRSHRAWTRSRARLRMLPTRAGSTSTGRRSIRPSRASHSEPSPVRRTASGTPPLRRRAWGSCSRTRQGRAPTASRSSIASRALYIELIAAAQEGPKDPVRKPRYEAIEKRASVDAGRICGLMKHDYPKLCRKPGEKPCNACWE